jgi:cell division protein FtsB
VPPLTLALEPLGEQLGRRQLRLQGRQRLGADQYRCRCRSLLDLGLGSRPRSRTLPLRRSLGSAIRASILQARHSGSSPMHSDREAEIGRLRAEAEDLRAEIRRLTEREYDMTDIIDDSNKARATLAAAQAEIEQLRKENDRLREMLGIATEALQKAGI